MRKSLKIALVGGGIAVLLAGTAVAFDGTRCGYRYGWQQGMGPGWQQGMMGPQGRGQWGPGQWGPGMWQGQMGPGMGQGWMGQGRTGMGQRKAMRGYGPARMFQRFDTNKDKVVTLDEFLAGSPGTKRFEAFDADNNGTVTKDEIDAVVAKRVAAMRDRILKRWDINGDGQVTKEEFDKPRTKRFALFDRNDDGKVEQNELQWMRGPWGRHGMRHHGMMRGGPGWGMGNWNMGPGMGSWGMGNRGMGPWGGPAMNPADNGDAPKAAPEKPAE